MLFSSPIIRPTIHSFRTYPIVSSSRNCQELCLMYSCGCDFSLRLGISVILCRKSRCPTSIICMNRSTFTTVVVARRRCCEARRHQYNKRPLNFHSYQVGDQVWAALHSRGRDKSRSLSDRLDGPFIVVEKLSDVIYVLRKPRRRQLFTLHYDCLKPFVARDPDRL